jgi:hypothetical protein
MGYFFDFGFGLLLFGFGFGLFALEYAICEVSML